MPLVHTFAPHPDESGLGYYRRLAAANALWGWKELAAIAGVARTRNGLLNSPETAAEQLGLESGWSLEAFQSEQSAAGFRGLHRAQHDAVCPECMRDEAYIRRHWEHVYVTACHKHEVQLQELCPDCNKLLVQSREQIETCECGFDLSTLPKMTATSSQVWLSALIANNGVEKAGVLPKSQAVDTHLLCDLVKLLCLYSDPLSAPRRRNEARSKSVREAIEFLSPLEDMLADWPRGFEEHVAQRIAHGNQDARTLNTLLGPWYLSLKKTCRDSGLNTFLDVVVRIAIRNFDGALGLDSVKHIVAGSSEYVTVADAAKSLGISRDTLVKALKAGKCAFRTRKFGTRGVQYEIPADEVENIASERRGWVSEKVAGLICDVPESVMRNMVDAKVVESDPQWRTDVFKGGPVSVTSIMELQVHLLKSAKPLKCSSNEWIEWAALTSRRLGDRKSIQDAMLAAAAGKMRAVVRGRRLGQIGFLKSDVMPYFATPVLEAGMSIQQLSKVTGWKWESISHWIASGLLTSETITLRGQSCRVISPENLLSFSRSYIPIADLARAIGTKPSYLTDKLKAADMVGAKSLPNGTRRGGLISLEVLGRLVVAGASTTEQ